MEDSSSNTSSVQTPNMHEILIFSIGHELFGIWPDDLLEIVEETECVPVPNSPPFLKGVINSHGRVVSVIDFTKLSRGEELQIVELARIAILKEEEFMAGLRIPADVQIRFFPGEKVEVASSQFEFFKEVKFVSDDGEHRLDVLDSEMVYEYLRDYFKKRAVREGVARIS